MYQLALISLLLIANILSAIADGLPTDNVRCTAKGLAKYNLTFEGKWSKDVFHKQYPLFRPNAQWSRAIGSNLNLYFEYFILNPLYDYSRFTVYFFVQIYTSVRRRNTSQLFNNVLNTAFTHITTTRVVTN